MMNLVSNVFEERSKDGRRVPRFLGNRSFFSKPYVVRVMDAKKSWIPVNVLVFATSEDDAIRRVRRGVIDSAREVQEKISELMTLRLHVEPHYLATSERWKQIAQLMRDKKNIEVERYDKGQITKIHWGWSGL